MSHAKRRNFDSPNVISFHEARDRALGRSPPPPQYNDTPLQEYNAMYTPQGKTPSNDPQSSVRYAQFPQTPGIHTRQQKANDNYGSLYSPHREPVNARKASATFDSSTSYEAQFTRQKLQASPAIYPRNNLHVQEYPYPGANTFTSEAKAAYERPTRGNDLAYKGPTLRQHLSSNIELTDHMGTPFTAKTSAQEDYQPFKFTQ